MPMISRTLALSLLLILVPVWPAAAAPTAAVAEPHLQPVTLAPGGPERNTLLRVRVRGVEPDTKARAEVTVDLGGASGFADVRVSSGFSASPVQACRRTGEKVLCSWTATSGIDFPALITALPKKTATIGDAAEIAVSARIGDGVVSSAATMIRVGERTGLAAGQARTIKAAAGRKVTFTPIVRNPGVTKIDGAVLVLPVNSRLLAPSSYRNCRYGSGLICTFDTELQPGRRYTLSQPITLRTPSDTVPGSAVRLVEQWMTKTERDEIEDGAAGSGELLRLRPMTVAPPRVLPDAGFATTTLTVTGDRRPTLTAVGVRREVAVGDEVTLSPGLVNFGPGTLRPGLFPNNRLAVATRMPGNVVAGDAGGCELSDGVHRCLLDQDLGPGQQASFPIEVQVAADCGDPGHVEMQEELPGSVRSTAELRADVRGATCGAVTALALPITGSGAGLGGFLLVVAGLLAVLGARRPIENR
ncbi:hypothetical protein [Actinoplanes solisilvae]|uniref:hypothetical protein n=1 Tax=Actinoplanes solisilvae TaxID=2486853 RepID=UPI000FDB783A|nr:hypothetical protein [Actinoplanes solisilvae]